MRHHMKWRGRFIVDRLDGLYDEPRPGAKRSITDAQVERRLIARRVSIAWWRRCAGGVGGSVNDDVLRSRPSMEGWLIYEALPTDASSAKTIDWGWGDVE